MTPRRWTKLERELAAAGAFILTVAIVAGLLWSWAATFYILVHAVGAAGNLAGIDDDEWNDADVGPIEVPKATARVRRA